jgi:hypothetical protein
MPTLVLLACLLGGCTGPLVAALEERQAQSCVYWSNWLGHGVTATGGVALERCLQVQCPCQLR